MRNEREILQCQKNVPGVVLVRKFMLFFIFWHEPIFYTATRFLCDFYCLCDDIKIENKGAKNSNVLTWYNLVLAAGNQKAIIYFHLPFQLSMSCSLICHFRRPCILFEICRHGEVKVVKSRKILIYSAIHLTWNV